MLSPDDCGTCTSHHGGQQIHDRQEAECATPVPNVSVMEGHNNETFNHTFIMRENDNKPIIGKDRRVLKQYKKGNVKQILSSNCHSMYKFKNSKNLSKHDIFNYIHILESTVKKQRKLITLLNLKLKKLNNANESKQNRTRVLCSMKVPRTDLDSDVVNEQLMLKRHLRSDIEIESSISNQTINSAVRQSGKSGYSLENVLCDNVGEMREVVDIPASVFSSNDGVIGGECLNEPALSDGVNSMENNLKGQMIDSDSRVHLYTSELNSLKPNAVEYGDEVERCIEGFMIRDDVSVADPSIESEEEEIPSRFRRNFLSVLYKQFHAEVSSKCTFSQFCKAIPKCIVKPSPTYWRNLLCSRCENTELKFAEIVNKVLLRKDVSLENVMAKQDLYENVSFQLLKLRGSQTPFTYRSWAKTLLGKTEASERIVTTTVGSACADILKELDLLKEHLVRCYNQYEAVREAREESEISPIHAIVHIDWYESPATFVARHMHTSYHNGDGFKTLHAGYVQTKEESYGFASLSDCREYTAPAVWASINDILVSLAKEGMKVITVVSDSATAQYKNKGNFYLMRRFAKQNNVEMKWIYLERGHGKGIADSIGAAVKQIMCDTIAQYPNKSFRNTMDILPLIKDLTPIKLFSHSENLVQQYKNLLSRQYLQVIPKTYKIHEVCVKETSFYVKESSSDKLPFFSLDTQSK